MSKIDVHHHFYPQAFRDALDEAGGDPSGWYIPPWSVELDRKICDEIGVRKAILSVTAPGPGIRKDSSAAARLARQCNEAAAAIRDANPSRYGFFASVPDLFDTANVLAEIRFALDELHADGITLFTRYGKGLHYLGDPSFEPVWAELSARKAVVFVHPTHLSDTTLVNPLLPQPMFDYPHETGRSGLDLIVSGRLRQHSGCKIILSHAGGTLPYLIHRAATLLPFVPSGIPGDVPNTREAILEAAGEFYFDTALSSGPPTLKALLEFAKPDHVLFGSDFPNAPRETILEFTGLFEQANIAGTTAEEATSKAASRTFGLDK